MSSGPLFYLGYGGRLVTESELVASEIWRGLDPELARRLLGMMKELAAHGIRYGVGGTLRSSEGQEQMFLTRHDQVSIGGCCTYRGRRYKLKSGFAHAAPPGSSYHEECTPQGRCLAADTVGDHWSAEKFMDRFGLLNFRNVNSEPWHFQPSDIPTGRKNFNVATMWPLEPWPLPGEHQPQEDDDMARIVRICEQDAAGEWQWIAPEQFVVSGASMEWLGSKERRDAVIAAGHATLNPGTGLPYRMSRESLKFFRLVGPLPADSVLKPSEFLPLD